MKRKKRTDFVYLPCSVGVSSVSRDRKRWSRSFRRDRLKRKDCSIEIIEVFLYRRETTDPDEVIAVDSGSVVDSLVVLCVDEDGE